MSLRLSDFDFDLPERLIARHPARPRDAARLLLVRAGGLEDRIVRDLPDILRPGDLMVVLKRALSRWRDECFPTTSEYVEALDEVVRALPSGPRR